MFLNNKKGITMVEILVVIAVLGIIFAVALPQFSKSREMQVLKSAVNDILSVLERAKGQTLASMDSSEYGVRFESDQVIIFKGMVFVSGNENNEIVDIISPATVSNVTLNGVSGSSGSLYFNRLSGIPSKTGTITISTSSYSKIITISATGSANVN
jgi:prepilin-type N-terminal cleavage/methylation domain-containing protein